MRVTKLIREYVEKTVTEAYKPKLEAVGVEYKEKRQALSDKIEAYVKNADNEIKKMIAEAGFEIRYGRERYISSYGEVCIQALEDENLSAIRKLQDERRAKINDILLNLELGATRAELDEMLKNIV